MGSHPLVTASCRLAALPVSAAVFAVGVSSLVTREGCSDLHDDYLLLLLYLLSLGHRQYDGRSSRGSCTSSSLGTVSGTLHSLFARHEWSRCCYVLTCFTCFFQARYASLHCIVHWDVDYTAYSTATGRSIRPWHCSGTAGQEAPYEARGQATRPDHLSWHPTRPRRVTPRHTTSSTSTARPNKKIHALLYTKNLSTCRRTSPADHPM